MSYRADRVRLPFDLVAQPGNLPRHCARHGRPATRRKDFALQSKVRIEGRRTFANVLTQTERLAQHGSKVQVIDVKDWPLCKVCVRRRSTWLAIACTLLFGGLAAFVGSLVAGALIDGVPWLAAVAAGGFVLMPLAAFPFVRGSMGKLIGARPSPDGESVIVESPSAAFVTDLPGHPS